MMGKLLKLAMMIGMVGWAQGAMACNNSSVVSVSFSASPVSIADWNPLSTSDAPSINFTITVTRASGNPNTDYALLVLRDPDTSTPIRVGQNGAFPGPEYSIKSGATDIAFATGAAATSNLRFDFANGNGQSQIQKTVTYAIRANTTSTDYTSGTYTENLGYSVQCFKSNNTSQGSYTSSSGLNLNVFIPNRLTVITAGPQTINFQNFTTTQQALAISLKSSGAINATISSANANKMILAGAVTPNTPINSRIDYTMIFDSQTVPAAGASLTNLTRAGVGGGTKSLVLTIPSAPPTGKLAGTYSDTITITLSAGS